MYKTQELYGYKLRATDGELGVVEDFYFDDETWSVRYVVVETGHWLRSRRVLISPIAIDGVDHGAGRMSVQLTRDQIANSPPIESDIPVSRQKELLYRQYFSWPAYWLAAYYPTPETVGLFPAAAGIDERVWRREPLMLNEPKGDRHLRSTRAITGHHVMAHGAEVGRVAGFVLDPEAWRLRDIVLDRRSLLRGHRDAISVYCIERVSWEMSTVVLNLSHRQIEALSAPPDRVEVK
jgi:uncharacterized protein YrrD